jgi:hypothetical protein
VIQFGPMQALRFLPLVVVAGVDGFAMFLPYLAVVCAAAFVVGRIKSRQQPVAA